MKKIIPSQKKQTEEFFERSIYQNRHLGWLDLWQLHETGGAVFSDRETLLGFQPVRGDIIWLHTFYSKNNPLQRDIIGNIRSCLSSGLYSLYSISSHKWYSSLLESNGFQKCDDIIEFMTGDIRPAGKQSCGEALIQEFHPEEYDTVRNKCEQAFPALWQLSKFEFDFACDDANYKRIIQIQDEIIGYLLADIDENSCHIMRIAVAPSHQRQGFAALLMNDLIRYCAAGNISLFSVNTNKKNSAAVCFYESLNFHLQNEAFPVYHRFLRTR